MILEGIKSLMTSNQMKTESFASKFLPNICFGVPNKIVVNISTKAASFLVGCKGCGHAYCCDAVCRLRRSSTSTVLRS